MWYRLFVVLLVSLIYIPALSQVSVSNKGEVVTITSGTFVFGIDDYNNLAPQATLNDNPQVLLNGYLQVSGNILNNSVDYFDNSLPINLLSAGSTGELVLTGSSHQVINGTSPVELYNLRLQKSGSLLLGRSISVSNALTFGAGSLFLASYQLNLGNSGVIMNETESNRIYGGGVGTTGEVLYSIPADPMTLTNPLGGLGLRLQGTIFGGGTSKIRRGHARQLTAADGSILRYYTVELGASQEVNNLRFYYFDAEVIGAGLTESTLALYMSTDGGTLWTKLGGTLDMVSNYMELSGVSFTGTVRLTLASGACALPPVVDIGPASMNFCDGATVDLDAGNPGLRFAWSTLETSQQITVSTDGNYSVVVTDTRGCQGGDAITLTRKPVPVTNFSTGVTCQDSLVTFTNSSSISDASALSFSWDFGDLAVLTDMSTNENDQYTYTSPASYNVRLIARSVFNCADTLVKVVTVYPKPIADFSFSKACLGQNTLFTNESAVPPPFGLTYDWDFGDATTSTQQDPVKSFGSATTYSVRLEVVSNTACKASVTQSVTVRKTPVADFTVANACENVDVSLNNLSTIASGTLTYLWDFGDASTSTTTEPAKTFAANGSYSITLTATSTFGCANSVTRPVTIYANPLAQFSVGDNCLDQSFSFVNESTSSQGSLSYAWNFGDGNTSITTAPVKSFVSHGSYAVSLMATTSFGCTDVFNRTVIVHPLPISDFDFTNACQTDAISFINQSGIASGSFTSQWNFDDGTLSTISNPVKSFAMDGTYDVVLTTTSDYGCVSSKTSQVEIYKLPIIDFGGASISTCGTSYVLDAGNMGSSYAWSSGATSQTLTVMQNGLYGVTVTTPDNCAAYNEVTITLQGDVLPDLGPDRAVCGSVALDAGYPGSTYLWSTGETTRFATVSYSGTYSVQVTDINGCLGTDDVLITVNPFPSVDLGGDRVVCADEIFTLNAGNPGAQYVWSDNSTSQTIQPVVSGTYSVMVTNSFGCKMSDAVRVTINPLPVNTFPSFLSVCDRIVLDAGNPGSSYAWSTNSTNRSIDATSSGSYSVLVTTSDNCSQTFTSGVTVNYSPRVELGADRNLCFGNSVVLDAGSEGDAYRWSSGADTRSLLADKTGLYRVEVSRTNGCLTKDSVTVTIYPTIENSLKTQYLLCANEPRTLNASSQQGIIYEWYKADGVVSNGASIVVSEPGTWRIITRDAIGCSRIDTVTVDVDAYPITARYLVASFVNMGDSVRFVQLSYPDPVTYNWNFADGITSSVSDPVHVYLRSGDFNSVLSVEDSNQCRDSKSKVITVRLLRSSVDEDDESVFIEIIQSSVYPNPAVEKVSLDIELSKETEIAISLCSLNGSLLDSRVLKALTVDEQFDISNLSPGVYILKVLVNNQLRSIRFIKL
jgi:PKD repeat protein